MLYYSIHNASAGLYNTPTQPYNTSLNITLAYVNRREQEAKTNLIGCLIYACHYLTYQCACSLVTKPQGSHLAVQVRVTTATHATAKIEAWRSDKQCSKTRYIGKVTEARVVLSQSKENDTLELTLALSPNKQGINKNIMNQQEPNCAISCNGITLICSGYIV